MKHILILLFIFSPITYAADVTYELTYPSLPERYKTDCDIYILNNSKSFIKEMSKLIEFHNNQSWAKSETILKKYIDNEGSDISLKKQKYLESLLNCSTFYTFSNNQDLFFKTRTKTQMYIMLLNLYTNKREMCPEDLEPRLNEIVKLTNTMNNIIANKAVKRD